jgi:hypothetical protein
MLPAVIQNVQVPPPENKRVVLCITRDVSAENLEILNEYGKVLSYDNTIHNNLDCSDFKWDYLVVDLRKSEDRYYFLKNIQPHKDKYAIAVYHFVFEEPSDIMETDPNVSFFCSFPKKQATQNIYNTLLLNSRIKKPRAILSAFKCCLNMYNKVK